MDSKQFKTMKIIIVFTLSFIIGVFVTTGNVIVPLVAVIVAIILMFLLKKNVHEVLSDERIERIAGKAGYLTYSASALSLAIICMVFMGLRQKFPGLFPVALAFSYTSCGMIVIYMCFFYYYSKKKI
jgi:uncharacterized membrane protein